LSLTDAHQRSGYEHEELAEFLQRDAADKMQAVLSFNLT
jgi:hypothetical protein